MIKTTVLTLACCTALASAAYAEANDYPAPTPYYPFQRSVLTPQRVIIPPYRHVFHVRVYTTPQQQPYYNVPPYPVVSPY